MQDEAPRFDVRGKIALVTGSARGLGRACAIALAQAGADVALGYRDARADGGTTDAIHALGRRALPLPGDAKIDWWITQEIARRIGLGWNYQHPSEIYAEMASLMPALDNISWDRIERESAVTYPSDAPDKPGHDVVFGDRFPTQDGRGKIVTAKILPPDERPDAEFPFVLSTGRQLEHWHTGAMTRRASTLDALEPGAVANLSRGTIAKLGIKPGDMVRVTTRRGTIELIARQDDAIPDGVVFIPFAFVEAAANLLTNPALDPFGKIPEFKYCAAKVEPVEDAARVAAE